MAAAIGWYGPLIDLSTASSHVDDLVQLLVFVHYSQPVQKVIASKRRPMLMTQIRVGDDTRPYFVLSVWHKYIMTMIVPGDVILMQRDEIISKKNLLSTGGTSFIIRACLANIRITFQDVKIVKFREVLEAVTLQISLLTVLAHGSNLIASKDNDQLIAHLQLGGMAREKLSRVMYWIQHTESTMNHVRTDTGQNKVQVPKNWKSPKDQKPTNCLSITDVLCLRCPCTIIVHAFIGEIFLPYSSRYDKVKEQLSLKKALLEMDKSRITEELICVGCKACGIPMGSRLPLYCSKNSNFVHDIGQIYRPFLLHVWDHAGLIPLLVKNTAATILFGNLTAEKVHTCYKKKSANKNSNSLHLEFHSPGSMDLAGDDDREPGSDLNSVNGDQNKPNFHHVWFILVKVLLQQQESPFQFEVNVDKEKGIENGRFELASLRMPCYASARQ